MSLCVTCKNRRQVGYFGESPPYRQSCYLLGPPHPAVAGPPRSLALLVQSSVPGRPWTSEHFFALIVALPPAGCAAGRRVCVRSKEQVEVRLRRIIGT